MNPLQTAFKSPYNVSYDNPVGLKRNVISVIFRNPGIEDRDI